MPSLLISQVCMVCHTNYSSFFNVYECRWSGSWSILASLCQFCAPLWSFCPGLGLFRPPWALRAPLCDPVWAYFWGVREANLVLKQPSQLIFGGNLQLLQCVTSSLLLSTLGCMQPDVRSGESGPACLPACCVTLSELPFSFSYIIVVSLSGLLDIKTTLL